MDWEIEQQLIELRREIKKLINKINDLEGRIYRVEERQ